MAMQKGESSSRPGTQAAGRQTQLSQGKGRSPLIAGGPKKPAPKWLLRRSPGEKIFPKRHKESIKISISYDLKGRHSCREEVELYSMCVCV